MHFESIKNKIVLLRCDFNEPIKDEILESTKRIEANVITIHELLARKNKVFLISHHSDAGQTLKLVFNYLEKSFQGKSKVKYINTIDQNVVKEYFNLNKNTHLDFNNPENENIILLENTRLFGEDLDESNDLGFAKFLGSPADCYVYDAFSVGHRDHASTTGVANILPSCFGPTFLKEYNSLKEITDNIPGSLIFMGGAKLSTKLPMVNRFLDAGATVCLGGAMTHQILKYQNVDIKESYLEKDFELDKKALNKLSEYVKNKSLILPTELIFNKEGNKIVDGIFNFEQIENIILEKNIKNTRIKNILWNGPVGMYEDGEIKGTADIYNFIKNLNNNTGDKKIFTVVGGGDTITFLEEEKTRENQKDETNENFENDFSYVSLSGGAMLEFLSTGTLPILSHISIKSVI